MMAMGGPVSGVLKPLMYPSSDGMGLFTGISHRRLAMTARQSGLSRELFVRRQSVIARRSGMSVRHSRRTSGVQARLSAAVSAWRLSSPALAGVAAAAASRTQATALRTKCLDVHSDVLIPNLLRSARNERLVAGTPSNESVAALPWKPYGFLPEVGKLSFGTWIPVWLPIL